MSAAAVPVELLAARGRADWPLHGSGATRALESRTAAALPPHALMQHAGGALASLARALAPHARHVWIAAGPGNNGGDGLVAAARLQQGGWHVSVGLAPAAARPADALAALAQAQAAGVTIVEAAAPPAGLAPVDLAIDALFGMGLSRAPAGWARDAIQALGAVAAPVLAVDLPSGLDADRGTLHGDAVRARWTLALLTLKPGLFTGAGRDHAGTVWFEALGADLGTQPATAVLQTLPPCAWPARLHTQHKGSFGDAWVVGGAPGMAGAALLAARAALGAGAGRVFAVLLDPHAPALDLLQPALMLRPSEALVDRGTRLEDATLVCGCGGGETQAALLPALISRAGRLLLDADALNALARDAALTPLLQGRAARGRATVLTPHPLEAARLLGVDTAAVQGDRLAAAQRLAERFQAVVVLKGSGSVIAAPGASPAINASGNAALASAGTGDVLAGWIGGLWAQSLDAAVAARLGVHSHGAAADAWQSTAPAAPLDASRLITELARLRGG